MKLLKFSSSTCSPCKALTKTLSEIDVPFALEEILVESDMETAKRYKVRAVPTLILVSDRGEAIGTNVGAISKDDLKQWFESLKELVAKLQQANLLDKI